jgi:hypothetical protein
MRPLSLRDAMTAAFKGPFKRRVLIEKISV